MFHELIYTSAPRGLAAGTKGFTTVASTPDMPKQLTSLLESLSGYRHLHHPQDAKAHLNPIAYSFLTTKVAGAQHFILSRVADAGLDYSQRTNKLAHHLAQAGQPDIPGGPAWLASQPAFFQTQWAGDPRLLPANRPTPGGTIQPAPCNAWKAAMGDAGWAGILAESLLDSKKAGAYLIVPTGLDLLSLIREAQALLPAGHRWKATFSTFFTKLPPNVDCRWRCVLEGTPEAASARRAHDRLLIDLTKPAREKPTGTWADAARNGTMPVAETVTKPRTPTLSPSRPAANTAPATSKAPASATATPAAPQAAAPVAPATPAPVASTSTSDSPAVTPGPPPPMAPQVSSPTNYGLAPPSLDDPYQPITDEPTVGVRGRGGSNPPSQRMLIVMGSVVAVLLLTLGGVVLLKQSPLKNEVAKGPSQEKKQLKEPPTKKKTPAPTPENTFEKAISEGDWRSAYSTKPKDNKTTDLLKTSLQTAIDENNWPEAREIVQRYQDGKPTLDAKVTTALNKKDHALALKIDPGNEKAKKLEQLAKKLAEHKKHLADLGKTNGYLKLPSYVDTTKQTLNKTTTKPLDGGYTEAELSFQIWKRSPISSQSSLLAKSDSINPWIIKDKDGKLIATLTAAPPETGKDSYEVKFAWGPDVKKEQAEQVAAGTIQLGADYYPFKLPEPADTRPPDTPTPIPAKGPQGTATLNLSKDQSTSHIDLKRPKTVLTGSNEPLPLGTVSFTEPADHQFLTIALLGLSDLTLELPADSSESKIPATRRWEIKAGKDKIATISMQPMGSSDKQYKFTFLWEPTNKPKAVDHLKTGILKFNYAKFTEQGIEAAVVSFFPRHHTDTASKINLKQFQTGPLKFQEAPWLNSDKVNYTYSLEWEKQKSPLQKGKATDLLKTGAFTPILTVPQSLYPGSESYFVSKIKNARFWPTIKDRVYVTAHFKIHEPLPRGNKPTRFSLKTDFMFWRQVTGKREEWSTGLKKELERPETTNRIEQTINKMEMEIQPVKDKPDAKRTPEEKQRLKKYENEINEITRFKSSRKKFANANLRNSVQIHIRFTRRYGEDVITLYQAGMPD